MKTSVQVCRTFESVQWLTLETSSDIQSCLVLSFAGILAESKEQSGVFHNDEERKRASDARKGVNKSFKSAEKN